MVLGGFFGGGSSSSNNNNNNDTLPASSSSSSDAFSPSSLPLSGLGSSSSSASGDVKTKLQNAITTQTALINAKYLITKINENCFEHCVPDPGASLSGREQTCLNTCMEKYIDGWNVVSKTYVSRLQKEGAALQAGGMGGGI